MTDHKPHPRVEFIRQWRADHRDQPEAPAPSQPAVLWLDEDSEEPIIERLPPNPSFHAELEAFKKAFPGSGIDDYEVTIGALMNEATAQVLMREVTADFARTSAKYNAYWEYINELRGRRDDDLSTSKVVAYRAAKGDPRAIIIADEEPQS